MEQYGPIVESLGIQRLYSYTGGSVYVVRPFKKNSTNLGIRDLTLGKTRKGYIATQVVLCMWCVLLKKIVPISG